MPRQGSIPGFVSRAPLGRASVPCSLHHQECLPTQVDRGSRRGSEALLLLRAEARGVSTFWLDMAVRHDAKLTDIDRFLRRTWLECCGHMSEFSTGVQRKVSYEYEGQ